MSLHCVRLLLSTVQLAGPLYPWRQTAAGKRLCAPGYVHSCHCPCVIHHDILSGFLLSEIAVNLEGERKVAEDEASAGC